MYRALGWPICYVDIVKFFTCRSFDASNGSFTLFCWFALWTHTPQPVQTQKSSEAGQFSNENVFATLAACQERITRAPRPRPAKSHRVQHYRIKIRLLCCSVRSFHERMLFDWFMKVTLFGFSLRVCCLILGWAILLLCYSIIQWDCAIWFLMRKLQSILWWECACRLISNSIIVQ